MSETVSLPSFVAYGYEALCELGHNRLGGRQTFLARRHTEEPASSEAPEQVVIKQFRFAQSASNWQEYRAYEAEVEMLKQLNHPGIPRYISSFETPDGFCMVQEYKPAASLAEPRSWQPAAIKQVAIALLDILMYLQSQPVPVIHRDIKPENILVDDQRQVYLVDFGFARSGGEDLAASSLVKGTMGFMPPEQLFNRELTKASDLYSLGATLICLVTGVRSAQIGSLIQADYHIRFRDLVPPLHRGWLNWLEKLVEPHPQNRYPSAKAALLDLRTLNVSRAPKLKVDHRTLELQASRLGEPLQQTVALTNSIPDTHLSGRWDVVPHPHDPPHTPDAHPWIQVSPQYFEGNAVSCQVQVDTRDLQPGRSFHRELRLHTNATQGVETIPILVRTAPLPARLPNGAMAVAMGVFFALGCWLFYHQPLTLTVALVVVPVLFATVDFAWSWNVQYGAIPATKAIAYMVRRMTMTGLYAILAGVLSLLAVMALLSLLLVAAQKGFVGAETLVNGLGIQVTDRDLVQLDPLGTKVTFATGVLGVWLIGLTGWSLKLPKIHNQFVVDHNQTAPKTSRFVQVVISLFGLAWVWILINMAWFFNRVQPGFLAAIANSIGSLMFMILPIVGVAAGVLGLKRYGQWRCQGTERRDPIPPQDWLHLLLWTAGLSLAWGVWVAAWGQDWAAATDAPSRFTLLIVLLPLGLLSCTWGRRIYQNLYLHRRYRRWQARLIQP